MTLEIFGYFLKFRSVLIDTYNKIKKYTTAKSEKMLWLILKREPPNNGIIKILTVNQKYWGSNLKSNTAEQLTALLLKL
jgi:hypothetical protein